MRDVKTILVPTDFSECSEAALERAAVIARRFGAAIHVLHVCQPPDLPTEGASDSGVAELVSLLEKSAETRLATFVQRARDRGIDIERARVEAGAPARAIVELARRGPYDLIVLGTHGRRGLTRAVLGSVAERVVRWSACPVLSVRGAPPPDEVRRILVPIDYSSGSGHALSYASFVAQKLGAELDVVHVWDRPAFVPAHATVVLEGGAKRSLAELVRENAEQEMESFLLARAAKGQVNAPKHRLLSGEPAQTLLHELEHGQHQLVVTGTRGLLGLKHLLLGSVAEKLVRFSPVPVLTVPSPDRAEEPA